jgi:hypothetical protein
MKNNRLRQFQKVKSLYPGKSAFDLSYEKKLTCDMGQLIPVLCEEAVPGDYWQIGNRALTRMMPMVAPVMHEINMYVHYFFVPYRLLSEEGEGGWGSWEDFITGGVYGDDETELPLWIPASPPLKASQVSDLTLWDYMGFPMDTTLDTPIDCDGVYPLAFPRSAYNLIYNEYYRDETLQEEISWANEFITYRNWEKDYFTSAQLWQQRGTAPALPISGTTSAVWDANDLSGPSPMQTDGTDLPWSGTTQDTLNNNTVDLSVASTFDIADLRNAFQIQRWMERNARAGARYIEVIQSHFGESPRDERLQRPEYIGGSKVPLVISEVLQTGPATSTENTPQGTMSGHGITVSDAYCGKYKVKEYGLIMGIMSIMPRLSYSSQGVNRQWLRRTRYDFYWPEFAHLSEQAIEKGELCATTSAAHNNAVFGFQGRYDEMRVKDNMVVGKMRKDFDIWHLSRQFNVVTPPALTDDFIQCLGDSEEFKRIFAVTDEPGFFVNFGNVLKAVRPLPYIAEPGLIDHD